MESKIEKLNEEEMKPKESALIPNSSYFENFNPTKKDEDGGSLDADARDADAKSETSTSPTEGIIIQLPIHKFIYNCIVELPLHPFISAKSVQNHAFCNP